MCMAWQGLGGAGRLGGGAFGWSFSGGWVFRGGGGDAAAAAIYVGGQPMGDGGLKRRVVHVAGEDVFVLVHALDEERFEHAVEHQGEFVLWVHLGGLLQGNILCGGLDDLMEEKLVGGSEISAESVVNNVNQAGEGHRLLM